MNGEYTINPHPKTIVNDRKARRVATDDYLVAMGVEYLLDQASRHENCLDLSKRTPKSCNCLQRFSIADYDYCTAVAKYMVLFAKKEKFDQQLTVIEWMRYASKSSVQCRFIVPDLRSPSDVAGLVHNPNGAALAFVQVQKVCDYALMTILGYGLRFWRTVQKHAEDGTAPKHGLTDQPSNNSISEEAHMSLHLFFAEIKLHSEPTPMRFIREKTGMLTERDKDDVDLLPTYFTKRSLYRRYCFEQGWNSTTTSTGSPNKSTLRKDVEWGEEQPRDTVSWRSFLRFWAKHYPLLRVGKPSEDICNACHKYCNQLKFKKEIQDDDQDDERGVSDRELLDEVATEHDDQVVEGPLKNTDLLSVPEDTQQNEDIILEATTHVEAARAMRAYANSKMKEAKESNEAGVDWGSAKDCLVADYCQNMDLPHQGMTQPGETYYFSPLTINCFGTADAGQEFPCMNAYTYHEGEGKKGGNNVTSLLFKDLHDRGWVDKEKGPRDELTVIMDNCGGQNKNKYILRMLAFLTEVGFYNKVNACFLVAGHTKNICDRMFNLLKLSYRKSDLYSFPQLIEVLNVADNVSCIRVDTDDFKCWEQYEDQIYRQIVTGTVNRTHLFQFNSNTPGVMVTRDSAAENSHSAEQNLCKRMNAEVRSQLLRDYQKHLKTLEVPGIPEIKQWELWKKWRPYVPALYKDILCPKPTDEVCAKMKERGQEASKRAQNKKKASKKRQRSEIDQIQMSKEANERAIRDDSTQTETATTQANQTSHQMTLDSITTELNPHTPS